jgi:predicted porin
MKKQLLAAAVASACAAPAMAQVPAEIQVYGRVNVSVEHQTIKNSPTATDNVDTNALVDNSSRIGFRGNKQLNSDLKAIWQIESRVRLDTGGSVAGETAFLSSRDTWAGLQGGFGTIKAGRSIGPVYYATYDYISMHNHDTGTSSDALLDGSIYGNAGFMNNLLWYTSPKLGGGFSVDLAYSFGPDGGSESRVPGLSDQPNYMGIVGAYDSGPLHVALSWAQTENTELLPSGAGNSDSAITLGGAYNFKSFIIGALVEMSERDNRVTSLSEDRTYWRISGMVPVGQHEFHLNYGQAGDRMADDGAKQYTIAYNYNITNTTKLYAFYTAVNNDTGGTYFTGTPAADFSSIAVGFRHNF